MSKLGTSIIVPGAGGTRPPRPVFPYFGNKSAIAPVVWHLIGQVRHYVEPFAGSLAVLMARPRPFAGHETANDASALLGNFYRAVTSDPDAVAEHADYPISSCDLHARHAHLVANKDDLRERLEGDPFWPGDPLLAGWYAWGLSSWIGSGWCTGDGSWHVVEQDGVRRLRFRPDADKDGLGIQRHRPHYGYQGVHRQGRRQLLDDLRRLGERLRYAHILCGDWLQAVGNNSARESALFGAGSPCGVFFDPPYGADADRDMDVYEIDSGTVAADVRAWCIDHGDDRRLRIVLAGYEGEHNELEQRGWKVIKWSTKGGYSTTGQGETRGKLNALRERLWCSPHCVRVAREAVFFDDL